jgi:phosphoglycerate dehydrogenase-like enzyme
MSTKPKAVYILSADNFSKIYGPDEQRDLAERFDFPFPPQTSESLASDWSRFKDVEFVFSGWGAHPLDTNFLNHFPKLKAFFYGAGSIKSTVRPEFWKKNIPIVSAWAANAVPVSEYTLSQILFSLKHGWRFAFGTKNNPTGYSKKNIEVPGAYGSKVGLISMGMIGRLVRERLKPFNVEVLAFSPDLDDEKAKALDVRRVSLETLFRESDVVSCHTPWLKETERMLREEHFASMKPNATFINTARGAVVDEAGLIKVLEKRPDLWALLDVTWPEPPAADSPLRTLPNVIYTPHIAGSMDNECRRMGRTMIEEYDLFAKGQPMRYQVSEKMAQTLA